MNTKKFALVALAPAAMALGIAMHSSPAAQAAESSSLGSSSSVMGSLGSSHSNLGNIGDSIKLPVGDLITLPEEKSPAPKPNPAPKPAPAPNIEQMKTQVHNQTNALRAKQGVKPLTYNRVVAQDSQRWADQMARTGNFNHDPSLKTTYEYVYAENIYKMSGGQITASRLVDAWYNSPGHRNTMLNPEWNLTGVGISRSGKDWYAVARFTNTQRFINHHPRPGF